MNTCGDISDVCVSPPPTTLAIFCSHLTATASHPVHPVHTVVTYTSTTKINKKEAKSDKFYRDLEPVYTVTKLIWVLRIKKYSNRSLLERMQGWSWRLPPPLRWGWVDMILPKFWICSTFVFPLFSWRRYKDFSSLRGKL